MTKQEVVTTVLNHKKPPYVPWNLGFTQEAYEKLRNYYEVDDLEKVLDNHFVTLGNPIGFFEDIGNDRVKDVFGVVWNREVDKDIGIVEGQVLPEPSLKDYKFPDPEDPRFFSDIPAKIKEYPDRFRVFEVGFSLYERAWSLRGMESLLMDFIENPDFAHELLNAICEYNLVHVKKALEQDIDAVLFGDDWGQQSGLIMGPKIWHKFIEPCLRKMYGLVRDAGKFVMIHSCGDVDELFDSLVRIGLNCFNPFQPEVMDVYNLLPVYRNKLSFFGGLSTQRILPYGTVNNVKIETCKLLSLGSNGGYIFSPAHAVEGDVPVENMVAFIDELQNQEGYLKNNVPERPRAFIHA